MRFRFFNLLRLEKRVEDSSVNEVLRRASRLSRKKLSPTIAAQATSHPLVRNGIKSGTPKYPHAATVDASQINQVRRVLAKIY